jgi:hypothetical protein
VNERGEGFMADFLFVFGYESPEEWRTNHEHGTDFESTSASHHACGPDERRTN